MDKEEIAFKTIFMMVIACVIFMCMGGPHTAAFVSGFITFQITSKLIEKFITNKKKD